MKKNCLLKYNEEIIRVLELKNNKTLIIDCKNRAIPKWVEITALDSYESCTEQALLEQTHIIISSIESVSAYSRKFAYEHYTLIAGVLPFISDKTERCNIIAKISESKNISKQTIRYYLCLYLVYQNVSALVPKQSKHDKHLTKDEKNIRWGLNKFFYSKNRHSLNTAYTLMLKEKYCDNCGVLLPTHPSFYQFRYFYRKHRNMQTYYIARDGLKNYQRNNRPLLGNGVQEFAPFVGVGMLDATVCDIYIVNDSGNLVGRPILTACIDAYSSLCCGYSLSWEGGTYSLRGLLLNVIADKVKHCKKHGISIQKSVWDCDKIPAVFVTDMGSEYKSETFEQITELGVTVINLPAYRPELKGSAEKFFDLIQNSFKPYLKGKGVIEPDYQERGSHDYRKDACLTMEQFEKIIIRCIIYYNSKRVKENYPYTEDMLDANIKPYASDIWNYGLKQSGANLISVTAEELILVLLPRATGRFCRFGLNVNRLRYKHDNYTNMYLNVSTVTVAYNPDDVSYIWLIENGAYIRFELIESRFSGKNLFSVRALQDNQKQLVKNAANDNLQAQIELAEHIVTIASVSAAHESISIKSIRNTRQKERSRTHIDFVKEGAVND